jgi:RHS repeat-associated protein
MTTAVAVAASTLMLSAPVEAAARATVVLDPDNDVAHVTWPAYGLVTELPLNIRLANEVKTRLQDNCKANVVLTRDNPNVPTVPVATRRAVAEAANPDLMVTVAFNALTGSPWGVQTDGGPRAYAPPEYAGFAAKFLNQVSAFTGRPSTLGVGTAPLSPWYPGYSGLPFPYAQIEALFLDHNYDHEVILDPEGRGFGYIADGVTAAIQDELVARGLSCSKYPSRPSADELARLRNLGYQNFLRYGADPVSMSTGNFVTSEALFELTGVGSQVVDTTLHYNAQSGLDSQVGTGWSFAYGSYVQLFDDDSAGVTLADGRSFLFESNGSGGFVGPSDAYATLRYDGATALVWTSASGDESMGFALDEDTGRAALTWTRDRQGNTIRLAYNGTGDLFPKLSAITDQAGQTVAVATNSQGRITAFTRPGGAVWKLGYSNDGDLVRLESPAGRVKGFGYDSAHRMTSETGADGVVWLRNTYDQQSRVVKQTTSMGYTRTLVFDDAAKTTTFTDATGAVTVYHWNDLKQVTKVVDALGGVTLTEYTNTALTAAEVTPTGAKTSYVYNQAGLPTKVTDPSGAVQTLEYNNSGDVVKATDQGGPDGADRSTAFEVNAQGLPTKVTNPDGTTVTSVYNANGDVTSVTDELGQTTTIAYDSRGNTTAVTDPTGATFSYTYDTANRLTSAKDPLGAVTSYAYDADDNLTKTTYADATWEAWEYDANAQVVKWTDQRGAVTAYQYDTELNLLATTAPDGGVTKYGYDKENRLVKITDPLGHATGYSLDALGRPKAITDGRGNTTKTAYDAAGRVTAETDAAGFTTSYARDARGLATQVTNPDGGVTTAAYDAAGRITAVTDPLGAVTSYGYDWRDQVVSVTDPDGGVVARAYDAAGRLTAETDQRGATTAYTLDGAGRVTAETDALGGVTAFAYDAAGNQVAVTDPNGNTSKAVYDALGRVTAETDGLGRTTQYALDAGGLVTAVTDPLGRKTLTEYDQAGRAVAVTDAGGHKTKLAYDLGGNLVGATDADGIVTRYGYDANGNLASVVENAVEGGPSTNQQNVTTKYGYDPRDLLATITDANGGVTAFEYGANGQVSKETDQIGRVTVYGWDLAGRLASETAATGVTANYTYDLSGNLTKRAYSTGKAETFAYDEVGNQTLAVNATGTVTTAYDLLRRVTTTTDAGGHTLAYGYDPAGNRTSLTLPGGEKLAYTLDAAGQTTAIDSQLGQVTVAYDAAGQPTAVTRGDGSVVTTSYTPTGQIASLTTVGAKAKQLASFAYTYTDTGLVASRTSQVDKDKPVTATYAYDPLGRLVADEGGALPSTYVYDAVGNRVQWTAPNDPSTVKKDDWIVQDNAYDAAGQLTQSVQTRRYCGKKTKIATTTNTWDLAGNLILSSTKTGTAKPNLMGYQYDEANHLTAYGEDLTLELEERSPSLTALEYKLAVKHAVTFTYDALGRVVNQDLKTEHVTWTHDGLDPVYAMDGKTPEIYLRDAYGELLGQQVGKKGTPEWYIQDALYSIVGTVEKGKLQTKDTDYTDYGIQLKDLNLRFGYSGERTDPEDNQVVHYYARTYQPTLATWVQADLYRGTLERPVTVQRHEFVGDNPSTFRDFLGYLISIIPTDLFDRAGIETGKKIQNQESPRQRSTTPYHLIDKIEIIKDNGEGGTTIRVTPTTQGRLTLFLFSPGSPRDLIAEYCGKVGNQYCTQQLIWQLQCHTAVVFKQSWNLDTQKTRKSYWETIFSGCN